MVTSSWAFTGSMSLGETSWTKARIMLINNTSTFSYPDNPTGYAEVGDGYVGNLSAIVGYYFNHTRLCD